MVKVAAPLVLALLIASPAVAQPEVELARPLAERAPRWRCEPTRAVHCSTEGCKQIQATVWMVLDFNEKSYERCDARGCDRRTLTMSQSGIFTVAMVGGGTFLKAVNDGSDFVDVATLGTAVFASFGRCRVEGER